MAKVMSAHQIHYLPGLRYFEKIDRVDCFIVLDDVQFSKGDWQNRNYIKTSSGVVPLTVPVKQKLGQALNQVKIASERWSKKHWLTLSYTYSKAPFFKNYSDTFEEVYQRGWKTLFQLSYCLLCVCIKALGIDTKIIVSSSLNVDGKSNERLVGLAHAVEADTYYTGKGARTYLDHDLFAREGITIEEQNWVTPCYEQQHGEFVGDLSVVDLLFNHGPQSLEIIRSGRM